MQSFVHIMQYSVYLQGQDNIFTSDVLWHLLCVVSAISLASTAPSAPWVRILWSFCRWMGVRGAIIATSTFGEVIILSSQVKMRM